MRPPKRVAQLVWGDTGRPNRFAGSMDGPLFGGSTGLPNGSGGFGLVLVRPTGLGAVRFACMLVGTYRNW